MSKLNVQEFIEKWEAKLAIEDNDVAIEFREDIADSLSDGSEELDAMKAENEKLKADIDNLKERYKKRFLTSEVFEEKEEEIKDEEIEEPKEEEIIDVKEI